MDIKTNINSTDKGIKFSVQKNFYKKRNEISFASNPPVYRVTNSSLLKKIIPTTAFVCAMTSATGYLLGGLGLSYDIYKENNGNLKACFKRKPKTANAKDEGVKTITANTQIGKLGIKCAKVGVTASAISGVACGLGEGIPTMALGESTNLAAAPIINTPIGTGLFGIGIASIFSGLALDNTPELKLNHLHLMAAGDFSKKTKIIFKNTGGVVKEVLASVAGMVANIYKPKFWKDNLLHTTPKNIVFQEMINKDGKVVVSKMLRHHKNYFMHSASFTLGLGGAGIITATLFNKKKAQKAALYGEEGGFLFDNIGMTRMGLDKLTTGGKPAGSSFALGGIINAISQFMGLDNKDGRAVQWLGIALVFLGFSIDRGKHLADDVANSKFRGELTDVVREWKIDLSKFFEKKELKALLKEIKAQAAEKNKDKNLPITNEKFNEIEAAFKQAVGITKDNPMGDKLKNKSVIEFALEKYVGEITKKGAFQYQEISDVEESKRVLKFCTKKIFGSEDLKPLSEDEKNELKKHKFW